MTRPLLILCTATFLAVFLFLFLLSVVAPDVPTPTGLPKYQTTHETR